MILLLCIIMSGHLFQVWRLYFQSEKVPEAALNGEELENLN